MFHDLLVVLFATTAGFTASGIIANIYRLLTKKKAEKPLEKISYWAAMAFWLATAISGYWSFALGLFVIQLALAI